ncbi:MAG: hypothetical protein ABL967_05450 [Bryobacteraceae bacterium]
MTVQVTGDHAAAQMLRAYLKSIGYEVLDVTSRAVADFIVQIEQGTQPNVVLEGVRGRLADEALHSIALIAGVPVEWRAAIAGSENIIRVIAGANQNEALGRGLLQALLAAGSIRTWGAIRGRILGFLSRFLRKSN